MKFIFLGHACFQIDTGKEKLLFDPFLTGNGLAEEAASKVECDYIFFPMPMRIILEMLLPLRNGQVQKSSLFLKSSDFFRKP